LVYVSIAPQPKQAAGPGSREVLTGRDTPIQHLTGPEAHRAADAGSRKVLTRQNNEAEMVEPFLVT
jgi:hypothetical protein